jgi:O-acetyl-ADP-ribose deacetylase (regulator of RNase III)
MKIINGNIITLALQGQFDAIVQGCNCKATMGAGLAAQIRNKLPGAYQADLDYSIQTKMQGRDDYSKLGNFSICIVNQYTDRDNQTTMTSEFDVINAYIQYHPGPDLRYNALQMCLEKINVSYAGKKVALPQIGCGIAGGDWHKVEELIKRHLYDCDVTIVMFK